MEKLCDVRKDDSRFDLTHYDKYLNVGIYDNAMGFGTAKVSHDEIVCGSMVVVGGSSGR